MELTALRTPDRARWNAAYGSGIGVVALVEWSVRHRAFSPVRGYPAAPSQPSDQSCCSNSRGLRA
jgi:hypothetical protein